MRTALAFFKCTFPRKKIAKATTVELSNALGYWCIMYSIACRTMLLAFTALLLVCSACIFYRSFVGGLVGWTDVVLNVLYCLRALRSMHG